MSVSQMLRRAPVGGLAVAAITLNACASGGVAPTRPVHSSVRVESPSAAPAKPAPSEAGIVQSGGPLDAPPTLAVNRPALSASPERRIKLLEVQPGTPISQAVALVASQFNMGISIDPEVRGTTSATLRNVTLDSALNELVTRRGYSYQVQGSVLRVVPIRMETRNYKLDYVALSRVGTMSTVVQRRLSNNIGAYGGLQMGGSGAASGLSTGSAGFGNAGASGADVLTAQSVADVWQEIRVSLAGILQAGQSQTARAGLEQANNANANGGGTYGSGATSASFADGSSLVISPMSGLINVTAMPDKLRDIEAFIDTFQASVLRQVMIEAKIVEVTLNKTFEFGIDWRVVGENGRATFDLRNDPTTQSTGNAGNINFTLTNGSTSITAVLTALASQGAVNVLSNEKTTALNNQRAIFNVTTDEVFFNISRTPLLGPTGGVISLQNQVIPQQISVGVVLDVLPQISADNILTMDIRPAVTSIARVDSISLSDGTSATAPVIARREGDTIARLRAGETMVIGGLVQTKKENAEGGIPFLKDIPLLGWAFKSVKQVETRTELVIFLTPTIVSGAPATGGGR
jgi:MSHA biogenesis protein MshL